MPAILFTEKPNIYYPVLRVFRRGSGASFFTQPPPSTFMSLQTGGVWSEDLRQITFNGVTVPAFFGQILDGNVSESEQGALSVSLSFPYAPIDSENDLYLRERKALVPTGHFESHGTGDVKPFFTVTDLHPGYLYRLDLLEESPEGWLNTYYASAKEESNLQTLDAAINGASKEKYWLILSDYDFDTTSTNSSFSLIFSDVSYKLFEAWNDIKIPNHIIYGWIAGLSSELQGFLVEEVVRNNLSYSVPVFDGWKLPGVCLAILYYAYLFPAGDLGSVTLTRESVGGVVTYSLNVGGSPAPVLRIDSSLDSISIPYSIFYPNRDDLLSDGYYLEVPPFEKLQETLANLSTMIGFFWSFDSDGVLNVTSESYTSPATVYKLTGANIFSTDYTYDDSNLRNLVGVIGRPYGLNLQFSSGQIPAPESIKKFGYKKFTFESPLVVSDGMAQNIAHNILSTYAYNVGSINIKLPASNVIKLYSPVVLDINATYTTVSGGIEYPLYVYDRSVSFERNKAASMTLGLKPKIERTVVELEQGLTNLSMVDGINPDDIEFVFTIDEEEKPQGATLLARSDNIIATGITSTDASGQWHTSDFSYLERRFGWGKTRTVYRTFNSNSTVVFTFTWIQNGSPTSTSRNINITVPAGTRVTYKFMVVTIMTGVWSIPNLLYVDLAVCDINHPIASRAVYSIVYGASVDSGALKYTFDFGSSASQIGGHYVGYKLNDLAETRNTFFNSFKINYNGDLHGFIEAGFLVVPASPVYRDNNGVVFGGITLLPSGELHVDRPLDEHRSVPEIILDLNKASSEGYTIHGGGNLITYGRVRDVHGIDPTSQHSSITDRVMSQYYMMKDSSEEDHRAKIYFDPYIAADDGRLAFANVFVLVPYVKLLVDGVHKVYPKPPFFVMHAKMPDTLDKPLFQYMDDKSGIEYVGNAILEYPVAQLNDGDDNKLWWELRKGDQYVTAKIKYASHFPFRLRLALNKGTNPTFQGNQIKNADLTTDTHIYYSQYCNASNSVKELTMTPFSHLQEIVGWAEDVEGKKGTMALVAFVDPFYMFSIEHFTDNKGFSPGNRESNEKIASFLVATSSGSAIAKPVANFINVSRSRYTDGSPDESDQKIGEWLLIRYDRDKFTAS